MRAMLAAMTQRLARSAPRLRSRPALIRCTKGATAVEFALVAAPFLALLVAMFQASLVFFASRVLDEITEEASRYIMTGQAQTASMTQSQFATFLCTGSNTSTLVSALFNCNNIMINVQNYASFAAASTTSPTLTFNGSGNVNNAWTYNTGNPGDIVVVQVMYQWPIVLGPLGFNLSNLSNGNRLLVSTAVFKNEPY
jgi:Flp pilus assembly protein TadG